jgi:hypothetical protein
VNRPNHNSPVPQTDAKRASVRVPARGRFAQTNLVVEPADILGAEQIRGLIDEWLVPIIAEHFVYDLISSGEESEKDK